MHYSAKPFNTLPPLKRAAYTAYSTPDCPFYGMLIARYFIIKPYERAVCFFFLLKQHTAALLKQLKTREECVPI